MWIMLYTNLQQGDKMLRSIRRSRHEDLLPLYLAGHRRVLKAEMDEIHHKLALFSFRLTFSLRFPSDVKKSEGMWFWSIKTIKKALITINIEHLQHFSCLQHVVSMLLCLQSPLINRTFNIVLMKCFMTMPW